MSVNDQKHFWYQKKILCWYSTETCKQTWRFTLLYRTKGNNSKLLMTQNFKDTTNNSTSSNLGSKWKWFDQKYSIEILIQNTKGPIIIKITFRYTWVKMAPCIKSTLAILVHKCSKYRVIVMSTLNICI